jgi:hypothetical protein
MVFMQSIASNHFLRVLQGSSQVHVGPGLFVISGQKSAKKKTTGVAAGQVLACAIASVSSCSPCRHTDNGPVLNALELFFAAVPF